MSRDMVYETLPRVSRRVGDTVIAGANNSTIVLGRDRLGNVDSGYGSASHSDGGKSAGAMSLVVGRQSEDLEISTDAATVYLSQRCDPDDAADTSGVGSGAYDRSAIVMRADCIRIVPRDDFKISVGSAYITITSDGRITLDGDISLGKSAAYSVLRGELVAAMHTAHTHIIPASPVAPGPSGLMSVPTVSSPPMQPVPPSVYSPRTKVA